MALPLWTAYEQVGIKEEISDVISNISPTKTPFQSMIGSEKIDNKFYQWQEDSLRAVGVNAKVEGFTAAAVNPTPTVMRSNNTQILSETITVSGTSDAVAHYGRAKESAYQMAKSSAQVKRDFENALVGTAQSTVVGDNAGTPRQLAGFQRQVLKDGTNVLSATNSVIYTGAVGTVPAETTHVLPLLQQLYNNGVDPSCIMVTPPNAVTFANFVTGSRSRQITSDSSAAAQRTIVNVVEVYVSPFGEQKIVLNRFLKSDNPNTLVFDPEMWKKATLRPWFRETLAKTGDNLSMMIVGEYGLKHKNFGAAGVIVQAVGNSTF